MVRRPTCQRRPVTLAPESLTTQRLQIRTSSPEDAAAVLDFRLRNRDFLQPWLPLQSEEAFSLTTIEQSLKDEWVDWQAGKCFRFLVSRIEEPDVIIGDIRFSNIIRGAFQSAFLGYLQDEASCGKGYMSEGLGRCLWYMFAIEKLHRVEANIIPRNLSSIALAERLGFRKEGYSPRYLQINGVWEDHIRFALLNE